MRSYLTYHNCLLRRLLNLYGYFIADLISGFNCTISCTHHLINFDYPFKGLVEDEREAATVAAPQKMMPKMPPGINVRRRTGPTTQAAAAAAAVAVGPAPAKRPKQQAAEPAVPRKQPQSAAAQGCNSMDI